VAEARAAYIPVTELGKTGGSEIILNDKDRVGLAKLRAAHEDWFPRFMGREEIPLTN
jgi:phosphoribosylformylglycinamidine synthase